MSAPAPRTPVERPVDITFGHSETSVRGLSQNISATGMLVLVEGFGRPGDFLRFDLYELSGTGEVVWSRRHDDGRTFLGIRFVSMARSGRDALLKLLSRGA